MTMFNESQGRELSRLAKHALNNVVNSTLQASYEKEKFSEAYGVFVTLKKDEDLRGCIGFTDALYPLYDGIIRATRLAATQDPRFPAITQDELKDIRIEISVLTPAEEISYSGEDIFDKIRIGIDGLIVKSGIRQGLLLPQVATEQGWNPQEFLEHCCLKANLPPNAWKEGISVARFQAQIFKEAEESD